MAWGPTMRKVSGGARSGKHSGDQLGDGRYFCDQIVDALSRRQPLIEDGRELVVVPRLSCPELEQLVGVRWIHSPLERVVAFRWRAPRDTGSVDSIPVVFTDGAGYRQAVFVSSDHPHTAVEPPKPCICLGVS